MWLQMKIRNGFVSNSSSSSFIILIKNNTNRTLMFNEFLKLIYPDILPCIKRHPQYNIFPLHDLLYNDISFKIKPGLNKYNVDRHTDQSGDMQFNDHHESLIYLLDKCHDPKKRFEWTIKEAGNLINDLEDDDVTWEAGFGKDAYRKKKTAKPKPKRKVVKKPVKKCRCK
jgi:hypothetical protein